MKDTDKYSSCIGNPEVNAQVREMVQALQCRCTAWDKKLKRTVVALKTIVILAVVGLEYHFLPNPECQYVIGYNAHKPMVVCEQLNNTLTQCINFA